ncbi:MAG: hypothetical protein OXD32_07780, partial [Endozoicomonadaceae bacterium]|nr:hypothetical protein [Endozoicomonadaceae bacterium]
MESEVMNLYSTRPAKSVYAKNVILNVFKTLPKLTDSHEFGFIDTIERLIRKFICFLKNMICRCASTKSKQENLLEQSIKILKEKNILGADYNNDEIIRAITESNNILESLKKEAITNPVSFIERVRQLANKIQPYLTPTLQKTFENILDTCSEKDIKLFFERASILEDYSEQKIELLFERAKVPANRSKKDIKLFFERTKISENCSEQEIELLKKLFAEHPRIPKNFAELTVFRDIVFLGKPLTDSQCEEAILQALAREFVKTKMSPKKSEDLSNNIHEHLKLTNKINQMSSEATGEIDKDKTMQEQKNLWLQMHQIDPKSEKVLCFSKGSTLGKGKLGTTKLVAQEAIESMLSKNIIKECNPKLNQMHQVDPKSEKVPCFSEDSILGEGAFGTTQLVAPGDSGFILVKKTLKECNPKLNQPFKHKMNNPHCIPVIPVNFKDKDKFQYMVSGGAALEGYIFNFRVMRELIKYGVKKVEKIPKMQTLIYSCSSEPGARPKDCISKLKNLYSSCDKYDREDLENYLSSIELQIILGIQKNWQTLKLLDDCGDLYELNRKDIEELIFLID